MPDYDVSIAAVHPRMGHAGLPWPTARSEGASGYDVCAAIDKPLTLFAGELVTVPLGFSLEMPAGLEAQIRPRSGLSRHGLTMPNSVGTIDSDYRGEVKAIVYLLPLREPTANELGRPRLQPKDHHLVIAPGDRIAQMVFARVPSVCMARVPLGQLTPTARGTRGFGSTGVTA